MRRLLLCATLFAMLLAVPVATVVRRAEAGGPGGAFVIETTRLVSEVDRRQYRMRFANGTEIYTTDVRYLDGLKVGAKVRVRYESRNGRNVLVRIEPAAP